MKKFGDLFKQTYQEYVDKFTAILKISLLFYISITLLSILFISSIYLILSSNNLNFVTIMSSIESAAFNIPTVVLMKMIPSFVIFVLLFSILEVILFISFIYISVSDKKKIGLGESLKGALNNFFSVLGLSIVLFFALLFLFILLIVPGIIFMVFWLFSPFILIKEKAGIIDSLKRSKKLVKGRWWMVFGYYLLFLLISIGAFFALSFIPFIGSFFEYLIVVPFSILFFKNMYLDLKKNKK